ncbi:solute carrier family 39, member 9 [Methylomarinovum tepidoasis]|uniref:Solute carrier family 39, member 9 n=1 Tax=Methylomarinovum tepidoasis TaxID=2840183 RepID=A0AAU9CFN1_9GAMM|nr:ZIP family metal transporter [Methylomarinovum sp. IN45]BCX89641.1 solute carrier family 39, member 9 [Methylomarinovum sp. IN45]
MSAWSSAFAFALVAFLGALGAGLAPRYLPAFKAGHWPATTAIAAGLLLASAMVIVIPEGFEMLFMLHAPNTIPHSDTFLTLPPVLASGLAILGGFLLMLGLESWGIGHEIESPGDPTPLLSLGLALHALTDGLAIGASIATGLMAVSVPILTAVMVHKLPVAFGLGAFLWRKENPASDPWRQLLRFSLATPAGLLITFLFLHRLSHEWIGLLLLFSGGTFLYVAAVDVLSHIRQDQPPPVLFRRILIGVIILVTLLILFHNLGFEESHL